jgi:hypothetical protein
MVGGWEEEEGGFSAYVQKYLQEKHKKYSKDSL